LSPQRVQVNYTRAVACRRMSAARAGSIFTAAMLVSCDHGRTTREGSKITPRLTLYSCGASPKTRMMLSVAEVWLGPKVRSRSRRKGRLSQRRSSKGMINFICSQRSDCEMRASVKWGSSGNVEPAPISKERDREQFFERESQVASRFSRPTNEHPS
jgi:hypothetical protein